jgi:hypothetical protein
MKYLISPLVLLFVVLEISAQTWNALGSGTNAKLRALTVYNSNIIAGGDFTTAGGSTANYVGSWNGSSWSALGAGLDATVWSFGTYAGDLYAGGSFLNSGTTPISKIAKWNGSAWSSVGGGITGGNVRSMCVYNNDLYVGGNFGQAGTSTASRIAKWDGTTWSPVGTWTTGGVWCMTVYNSELYIGGYFSSAGGVPANNVAKWNGSGWSALGTGTGGTTGVNSGTVYSMAVYNGELYVTGNIETAGGTAVNYVAKWNGTNWSAVGTGLSGGTVNPGWTVGYALIVANNELYVGGDFTTAGGSPANRVAKWNGTSWSAVSTGTNDYVWSLTTAGTDVYAGGNFTSAGASFANYVAQWSTCTTAPSAPTAITGSTTACSGSSQTYSVPAVTGATSYTWTLPSGWTGTSTTNTITVTAGTTGGNITVVAVNSCGTSTAQTLAVTVSPGPSATITAAGATTFCQGGSVALNANTGTGLTYQWKLNGTNITGATTASYTANAAGSYTVVVTSSSCSSTSAATTVTVNPLPTATITQAGNVLTAPAGFASYKWYKNGTLITGATASTYTATSSGSYYVIVTNSNNCSGQSNAIGLTVGINDVSVSAIQLYPNPNDGSFYIDFSGSAKPLEVKAYNLLGQEVKITLNSVTAGKLGVEIINRQPGLYYLQLTFPGEVINTSVQIR